MLRIFPNKIFDAICEYYLKKKNLLCFDLWKLLLRPCIPTGIVLPVLLIRSYRKVQKIH